MPLCRGRFHYYEGFSMKEVTFPVYVLRLLGVRDLIVTNACGGINRSFAPGDLMLVTDYINMLGQNSLMGRQRSPLWTEISGYVRTLCRQMDPAG